MAWVISMTTQWLHRSNLCCLSWWHLLVGQSPVLKTCFCYLLSWSHLIQTSNGIASTFFASIHINYILALVVVGALKMKALPQAKDMQKASKLERSVSLSPPNKAFSEKMLMYLKVADASQAEMFYILYYHICDEQQPTKHQEWVDNRTAIAKSPFTPKVWSAMHDRGACFHFSWTVGM